MKRLSMLVLGAATLVAVQGCSKEAALYLGGPPGPAAAIQISASRVDLAAGGSATIAMRVVDAVGNLVPGVTPTISSGNTDIATVAAGAAQDQWEASATVTGVTLGEATLTVSAAGMTAEVMAYVGPASMTLEGPTDVPSGGTVTYQAHFWDLSGNELTLPADFPEPNLTSTNEARVSLTRTDRTSWEAAGAAPGDADLQLTEDTLANRIGPPVTAMVTATVVPGTFAGTISAMAGEPLDTIVLKAAAGRDWDGDEYVTLGSQVGINWTGKMGDPQFTGEADTLVFLVPVNLEPGDYTLTILRQTSKQIAEIVGTFTVQARSTAFPLWVNYPHSAPNTDGARLDGKVLPLSFPSVMVEGASSTGNSYYTARAGDDDLDWHIVLSWLDPGGDWDIDALWVNGAYDTYTNQDGATSANPEVADNVIDAGTMQFYRVNLYSGPAGATIAVQTTITSN